MNTHTDWTGEDRRALGNFIGKNAYKAAFLCHHIPMSQETLIKIVRGYHDPKGVLKARLRDTLSQFGSSPLPHDALLL